MTWWAVYSEPQREFLALEELQGTDEYPSYSCARVFLPYERITQRRPMAGRPGRFHKPETVSLPLFQRYLFVEDADFEAVSQTRGVFGVLTNGAGVPLVVHERDMQRLMDAADDDGMISAIDKTRLSLSFKGRLGSIFQFLGPLEGAQGTISSLDRLDSHGEVTTVVEMLGGRREINVPHQAVGSIVGSRADAPRLAASGAR